MSLQKWLIFLVLAYFLVFATLASAEQYADAKKFVVKELQISGNNMVSTTELLEKLPLTYVEYEIDPNSGEYKLDRTTKKPIVKDNYDFRVLNEIIDDPGKEREVSLKTIQGLTNYVLSVYREKGYAGIYVYIPADTVVDGEAYLVDKILSIEVLEGKVANITVERYDYTRQKLEKGYLKDSVLKSWSPIREGEVIKKKKLDYFVQLLNLNPDRHVSAVFSRSTEPNALNLVYDVFETNPWHWYLQLNNAGTQDKQWAPRIGVINTNFTGIDDKFSVMYQAPWEKGIEDEYAVIANYDFPIFTPRLRLNLYAAYSQFDIPAVGVGFLGNGSFDGGILSYNIFQVDGWFVDVIGSLSEERSKVTPSLGLSSDVDIDLWGIGFKIHRSNSDSDTSVIFNRADSMGGSSQDEFNQARINTDNDFVIYNFAGSHSGYLDRSKVNRLNCSFWYIDSTERLVPAKMTTFGGLYAVRGYKEDEIVADGGIFTSFQYEFDLMKHSESLENSRTKPEQNQDKKFWFKKLAPLTFIDYGRAKIKSPIAGERGITELCSLGVGTIFELGDNFRADMYYGWPLRGTDETDRGEGRWNFNFVYRF